MLRSFLWKILLGVMVLLSVHVHQHPLSAQGDGLSSDCVFCHHFGQPIAAPAMVYVLAVVLVWLAWASVRPLIVAVRRQYSPLSRGPPLYVVV